ncbi:hypothetical protein HMPREF1550_02045 [Actinomyces sp. oral taxon 877 str. F0543]|nr:hypothetical protein HMPREF1550_02045 [Actinomyces sp. oral taxon 877 str. F0543]
MLSWGAPRPRFHTRANRSGGAAPLRRAGSGYHGTPDSGTRLVGHRGDSLSNMETFLYAFHYGNTLRGRPGRGR